MGRLSEHTRWWRVLATISERGQICGSSVGNQARRSATEGARPAPVSGISRSNRWAPAAAAPVTVRHMILREKLSLEYGEMETGSEQYNGKD
jgi:hypothetical protein